MLLKQLDEEIEPFGRHGGDHDWIDNDDEPEIAPQAEPEVDEKDIL